MTAYEIVENLNRVVAEPDYATFRIIAMIFIILISVILHEVAHGYSAYKLGDTTAYYAGRLTLNPIKHIDFFMTILVPVILLISTHGQFVLGGAKPVPINPYNFRDSEKGMMITAIAGPLTNLLLGILGLVFFAISIKIQPMAPLIHFFFLQLVLINIILMAFNLIPIPPLDGSRVLRYFLPWNIKEFMDSIDRYGIIILIFLLMTTNIVNTILQLILNFVINIVMFLINTI